MSQGMKRLPSRKEQEVEPHQNQKKTPEKTVYIMEHINVIGTVINGAINTPPNSDFHDVRFT